MDQFRILIDREGRMVRMSFLFICVHLCIRKLQNLSFGDTQIRAECTADCQSGKRIMLRKAFLAVFDRLQK